MYVWIGGDQPQDVAALAREQIEVGFTAVKMNGSGRLTHIDTPRHAAEVRDRVAAVREAIGLDNDLVVDLHGRASTAMARRLLPLLELYMPLLVEELVLPERTPQPGRHCGRYRDPARRR